MVPKKPTLTDKLTAWQRAYAAVLEEMTGRTPEQVRELQGPPQYVSAPLAGNYTVIPADLSPVLTAAQVAAQLVAGADLSD